MSGTSASLKQHDTKWDITAPFLKHPPTTINSLHQHLVCTIHTKHCSNMPRPFRQHLLNLTARRAKTWEHYLKVAVQTTCHTDMALHCHWIKMLGMPTAPGLQQFKESACHYHIEDN